MPDERLLAPIRRFLSQPEVQTAYQAIFAAYNSRIENVTVIIGKGTEGDSASAQVVVNGEDYLRWMDALEARLAELESTADGVSAELHGTGHVNFGRKFLSV